MKKILSLIIFVTALVTSLTVSAHPGHGLHEQLHSFLHTEHLIALVAIIAVVSITKFIKK